MMAKVVVYATQFCPYCIRAKYLLNQKGVEFTEIDVTMNPQMRGEMQRLSGGHTVPQIFINEQSVGGFDELYTLEKSGELNNLLA
jgi:glutaredoxin 3